MYELNKIGENTYYINSPAKIGIYVKNGTDAFLVDSGNDKDAGKKILKILNENGWTLKAIVNTHSNADHIGGNKYLEQQTECKIFAPGIEAAFTKFPVLEPAFLYGGCPFSELKHKFLMAQESNALDVNRPDFPKELEIIPLKGHFFDMIGIRTPDNVVFLADCISSEATLEKYKISFIYDVAEYLNTLDEVDNLTAAVFVPSHAPACENIKEITEVNRRTVLEIAQKIKEILKEEMNFETLLKKLFDEYNLVMTYEQYVLVGSTVRSYLSWLKDRGEIKSEIKDNMLCWSI